MGVDEMARRILTYSLSNSYMLHFSSHVPRHSALQPEDFSSHVSTPACIPILMPKSIVGVRVEVSGQHGIHLYVVQATNLLLL